MSKAELMIQKYMTTQPYSIAPGQNLAAAQDTMKKYKIRHLPVVKDGKVVGMLSDRDIKLIEGFEDLDAAQILVADACVDKPYIVEPDAPLGEVVKEMASKRYGSAMVVQHGKLVGIFTTVDACRALSSILETRYHS